MQKTEYDYDTDVFDNVIAERDYDFGIGAPGALLRRTKLTWLKTNSINGVNYLASGVHILNRKLTDAAYDSLSDACQSQSRPCAQTTYEYDNYTAGLSSSNAVQHGSSFGATFTVRGNITAVQAYRNTDGASLTTRNQYHDAGNILSVTDPKSNTTTFIYADSWNNSSCLPVGGNAAAYISSTTNPKLQTSSSKYNSCTGTVASATDVNNQTTTFSYDALGRLVQTVFPPDSNNQHPQTTVTFNETSLPLSVTTSKSITSSSSLTSTVTLDGLGRMVKSELNSDPLGLIVDVTYDALGRKATESNPHRTASGPTDGIASFAYDAIGRPTQVTKPDNAIVTTTYYGTATQVADEGNGALRVQRISQTDGLGRMISVCEVSSGPYVGAGGASSPSLIGQGGTPSACGQLIAANGFLTSYTYDVLGNLLTTSQGGAMLRSFTYDSLSHLLQSVNPESGAISYTYDNNGNVLTRSDSRNTTITYSYDSLNRLTGKTYTNAGVTDPNTPPVTLTYDACPPSGCPTGMSTQNLVGRLVAASTPASALFSSYDALGRIKNQWQCTPVKCASGYFNLAFDYNLAGDLISESNGVGVTLSYAFDGVDRLQTATSSLSDANHPPTLVSNLQYGPMGVTAETLGNGATEAIAYTNRGQLQNLSVTVQNTTIYSLAMTYTPNGNALSANDSVNGNWTYSYDEMNRVVGASKNSGQQTYNYVYDRYGNRWQQNAPQGGNVQLLTFSVGNNNRMDGYSYDPAGNVAGDGINTFAYDVENRIHTVTNGGVVTTYVYDALGRRIRKTVGSTTTDYIYNLGGTAVAEVNGSGTWTRGEVFVGGKHVATYFSGTTYFAHVDWLGTERVHTNVSGAACETITSLIFGDGMATSGSCGDPSTRHFTGKERDAESGLDYFGARSYSSQFGRFVTPDWSAAPVAVPYADLTNPQSLNLYALVRGNPSTFADLDGHLAPGQLGSSGGMGITPRMRAGGGSAYGCLDTGCDSHIAVFEDATQGTDGTVGTEFFNSNQAQQGSGQPQTLSAQDVAKIIKSAEASSSDAVTTAINMFNNLGQNVTVSGDALRSGMKAANFAMPDALAPMVSNATSVTKSGNGITIESAKTAQYTIGDNTIKVDNTVRFNVQVGKGTAALTGMSGLHAKFGVFWPEFHEIRYSSTGQNKGNLDMKVGPKNIHMTCSSNGCQ